MNDKKEYDRIMINKDFTKDLAKLISQYRLENDSDTPDYILALYLSQCLDAFSCAIRTREKWYGRQYLKGGGFSAEDGSPLPPILTNDQKPCL
jgi:dsDNA-binding SOS-regulon protein